MLHIKILKLQLNHNYFVEVCNLFLNYNSFYQRFTFSGPAKCNQV